jgi:putative spermidine/putrescine transport system permease protein
MLIIPMVILYVFFFISPLAMLLVMSFSSEWATFSFSWMQYAKFFLEPMNLEVLVDTVLLGGKVVLFTTVMGYPIALFYMLLGPVGRRILLFLTVLPMLTSNVVRTLAWIVILGRQGLINATLLKLGLTSTPLEFMYTEFGLVLALSQIALPLLVLPLLGVLTKIDKSLWEASTSLGMNAWRTLVRIILPLSVPGLLAGWTLVFASASMNFVTQAVIGGARLIYLPLFVYQQINTVFNWPFAATVAVIMLSSTGMVLVVLTLLSRNRRINIYA